MQPQVYTTEPSTMEAIDKDGVEELNGCTRNINEFVSYTIRGQQFVVPQRYRVENCIGFGAYGFVVSAFDDKLNERVAIKKVCGVFDNGVEFAKRILREILILKHFSDHENIIQLKNVIKPKSFEEFKDVYICTDLMDESLRSFLNRKVELSEQQIQYLLYQILRALKYIHSANVLHRDIKPHNILINYNCEVKLCDFGLACGLLGEESANMSTHYVASRWYRAPELLLCHKEANKALDIWSIGCVFAEMLNSGSEKRVLFPGESYLKQIDLILNVLGSPKEEDIKGSPKARQYVSNRPVREKQEWKKKLPRINNQAADLLNKMLQFNPEKRITVDEALAHPYFENMADIESEPSCEQLFEIVNLPSKIEDIKMRMYEEIMSFSEVDPMNVSEM